MKHDIEKLLHAAVDALQEKHQLAKLSGFIQIEPTKDKQHGDFASNIALILAKTLQKKPREVAALIVEQLPASPLVQKVEIAGPGFINFFLTPDALTSIIPTILEQKSQFGRSKMGRAKKVLIEFVSSNPTGPLHVGHGRHAAFGAVVANLLDAVGFETYREYYINDAGRQMDILAVSVWFRYLQQQDESLPFPSNAYKGNYIIDIARKLRAEAGAKFDKPTAVIIQGLPLDEPAGGDKELYIDALIERAHDILADEYQVVFNFALDQIITDIRQDLSEFGVHFDNWFSERDEITPEIFNALMQKLTANHLVYVQDGATWFRSSKFGDEKDRVLLRSNGAKTYFANDVAYHLSKFDRGYDIAIDLLGSDHHGYTKRMKAAVEAMDINPERLVYLLMQFVSLYRNGEQVPMSTRNGEFVTLRELRQEVGNDAARYFYIMRKHEQPMDFDLELAKKKSNENPIFYVQYAHARICSVFKQLKDRQLSFDEQEGQNALNLLTAPHEREILNTLRKYPDMILNAAIDYEPHILTNYLRQLATDFHTYYNAQQFIVEDSHLRNARLALIKAVKQVLVNSFTLLGITAPETM